MQGDPEQAPLGIIAYVQIQDRAGLERPIEDAAHLAVVFLQHQNIARADERHGRGRAEPRRKLNDRQIWVVDGGNGKRGRVTEQ